MLEQIKKIEGINHDEFDEYITQQINAAKLDLKSIGIVDTLVDDPDDLVKSAITTYVISFLATNEEERAMWESSYNLQKDLLRHHIEYIDEV